MGNKATVLGVNIDCVTMSEAVEKLELFIKEKRPHLIATANAEMVMLAAKDRELANILNSSALVVPDGAGVVWAARHRGFKVPERVAGYDLSQRILAVAAIKGYKVFMFGGQQSVVERARTAALDWYPGINIVGVRHGFFTDEDDAAIIQEIKKAKPDILLVALGVPKQEKWLAKHIDELNIPVCMGVGGSFDVMAGTVQRAPIWMQRASLEWLFRLMLQPQRIFRMMALPRFAIKILLGKKC